ncbi:hypothetical protein TBLA_0J00690 [Henningerozyma blattae CBS 6284]|uniref:Uncharacterized protein n=1 Tax=Henningerozyma blattae (strain ATCC 34711 / CBS 6284 / DSM 70876 / NBRC 10599 / NRRL Y-10934 / UCD 77-7) TaxID=1071380 RepID=I2H9L5_HENB6|nr:hypothetical protein TBLA_0J00690 [Tetrapisispora blattae CBS 6284]CCH63067.1 hypothetical protein TBLA_0J00690 [Tetrapisispora blattae CBS 6284]
MSDEDINFNDLVGNILNAHNNQESQSQDESHIPVSTQDHQELPDFTADDESYLEAVANAIQTIDKNENENIATDKAEPPIDIPRTNNNDKPDTNATTTTKSITKSKAKPNNQEWPSQLQNNSKNTQTDQLDQDDENLRMAILQSLNQLTDDILVPEPITLTSENNNVVDSSKPSKKASTKKKKKSHSKVSSSSTTSQTLSKIKSDTITKSAAPSQKSSSLSRKKKKKDSISTVSATKHKDSKKSKSKDKKSSSQPSTANTNININTNDDDDDDLLNFEDIIKNFMQQGLTDDASNHIDQSSTLPEESQSIITADETQALVEAATKAFEQNLIDTTEPISFSSRHDSLNKVIKLSEPSISISKSKSKSKTKDKDRDKSKDKSKDKDKDRYKDKEKIKSKSKNKDKEKSKDKDKDKDRSKEKTKENEKLKSKEKDREREKESKSKSKSKLSKHKDKDPNNSNINDNDSNNNNALDSLKKKKKLKKVKKKLPKKVEPSTPQQRVTHIDSNDFSKALEEVVNSVVNTSLLTTSPSSPVETPHTDDAPGKPTFSSIPLLIENLYLSNDDTNIPTTSQVPNDDDNTSNTAVIPTVLHDKDDNNLEQADDGNFDLNQIMQKAMLLAFNEEQNDENEMNNNKNNNSNIINDNSNNNRLEPNLGDFNVKDILLPSKVSPKLSKFHEHKSKSKKSKRSSSSKDKKLSREKRKEKQREKSRERHKEREKEREHERNKKILKALNESSSLSLMEPLKATSTHLLTQDHFKKRYKKIASQVAEVAKKRNRDKRKAIKAKKQEEQLKARELKKIRKREELNKQERERKELEEIVSRGPPYPYDLRLTKNGKPKKPYRRWTPEELAKRNLLNSTNSGKVSKKRKDGKTELLEDTLRRIALLSENSTNVYVRNEGKDAGIENNDSTITTTTNRSLLNNIEGSLINSNRFQSLTGDLSKLSAQEVQDLKEYATRKLEEERNKTKSKKTRKHTFDPNAKTVVHKEKIKFHPPWSIPLHPPMVLPIARKNIKRHLHRWHSSKIHKKEKRIRVTRSVPQSLNFTGPKESIVPAFLAPIINTLKLAAKAKLKSGATAEETNKHLMYILKATKKTLSDSILKSKIGFSRTHPIKIETGKSIPPAPTKKPLNIPIFSLASIRKIDTSDDTTQSNDIKNKEAQQKKVLLTNTIHASVTSVDIDIDKVNVSDSIPDKSLSIIKVEGNKKVDSSLAHSTTITGPSIASTPSTSLHDSHVVSMPTSHARKSTNISLELSPSVSEHLSLDHDNLATGAKNKDIGISTIAYADQADKGKDEYVNDISSTLDLHNTTHSIGDAINAKENVNHAQTDASVIESSDLLGATKTMEIIENPETNHNIEGSNSEPIIIKDEPINSIISIPLHPSLPNDLSSISKDVNLNSASNKEDLNVSDSKNDTNLSLPLLIGSSTGEFTNDNEPKPSLAEILQNVEDINSNQNRNELNNNSMTEADQIKPIPESILHINGPMDHKKHVNSFTPKLNRVSKIDTSSNTSNIQGILEEIVKEQLIKKNGNSEIIPAGLTTIIKNTINSLLPLEENKNTIDVESLINPVFPALNGLPPPPNFKETLEAQQHAKAIKEVAPTATFLIRKQDRLKQASNEKPKNWVDFEIPEMFTIPGKRSIVLRYARKLFDKDEMDKLNRMLNNERKRKWRSANVLRNWEHETRARIKRLSNNKFKGNNNITEEEKEQWMEAEFENRMRDHNVTRADIENSGTTGKVKGSSMLDDSEVLNYIVQFTGSIETSKKIEKWLQEDAKYFMNNSQQPLTQLSLSQLPISKPPSITIEKVTTPGTMITG